MILKLTRLLAMLIALLTVSVPMTLIASAHGDEENQTFLQDDDDDDDDDGDDDDDDDNGNGNGNAGPSRASSYINPDRNSANPPAGTRNSDVNQNSGCRNPDQSDRQMVSPTGTTTNNVHNDACLFEGRGNSNPFDGRASFDSRGVGYISACPDPDGAGPKLAIPRDRNGDGFTDLCTLTGYQETGMAGDFEYHARMNSFTRGEQRVVFCFDPEANGCRDSRVSDDITIDWRRNR